jgi:hypothetical protein
MPDRPDHWKIVLIVVPIVATSTATAFYLLRIYSRIRALHGLLAEDILMGLGVICTYGVATCIVYCEYMPGSRELSPYNQVFLTALM